MAISDQTPLTRRRGVRQVLAVAIVAATLGGVAWRTAPADAVSATSNGWTTSAVVNASTVQRGSLVIVTVTVKSSAARSALIDVEIADNRANVHQKWWDVQSFTAGQTRTYKTTWTAPATAALTTHTVRAGVFGNGWTSLQHWNNNAASFTKTASPTSTTTTRPTTTTQATATTTRPTTTTTTRASTTTQATTTTRASTTTQASTTTRASTTTTRPPATGRFATLPVGASLPSDADCAARVRPTSEIRSYNAQYNQTKGSAPNSANPRVTGNFTGTTDEILQWAACKWGVDEDIVRAQIAKESWWKHNSRGDLTWDQSRCHPELRTASG